jgi:hypothetical protein
MKLALGQIATFLSEIDANSGTQTPIIPSTSDPANDAVIATFAVEACLIADEESPPGTNGSISVHRGCKRCQSDDRS